MTEQKVEAEVEAAEAEVELPDWLQEEAPSEPKAKEPAEPRVEAMPAPREEEEIPLPDWLTEPEEPRAAAETPGRGPPRGEFAFRVSPPSEAQFEARDPFAASFSRAAQIEVLPPFLAEDEAGAPARRGEAPSSPVADSVSIGDYLHHVLAAGDRVEPAARPTPTSPPSEGAGAPPPSVRPEEAAAPPKGAAPTPPPAGEPQAGESEDDLAQFQSWLRSLKR